MLYDLAIIGAGWAGFNAAVSAAKLGKSVCLIEEKELGGTCLNRGCIPTKVFVAESKKGVSLPEIQGRKNEVVHRLSQGMAYLLKTHKIDYLQGRGVLQGPGSIQVDGHGEVRSRFVLLATGSVPIELPSYPFDRQKTVTSDDVLQWQELPKSLLVVGGGFIGCEFASIFRRMGVDVTIVELQDRLLPGMDQELGKKLSQAFGKQGVRVYLKTNPDEMKRDDFDKILVSVGRKSTVEGVGSSRCALKIDKGAVGADRRLLTNIKNVYAAGDSVGGYLLAHVAAYEGELAVQNMFERPQNRDYGVIPASVFTAPEMASVGMTEEEARAFGASYEAKTVHYLSVGMSHVLGDTQGFVKVVCDKKKDRILGASIVGLEACELVNFFSVIIKNKIRVTDLKKTIFAHPSLSEIITELARAF